MRSLFIKDLSRYINGAVFVRSDLPISMISANILFRKYSDSLVNQYRNLENERQKQPKRSGCSLSVKPYQGSNSHVRRMGLYLKKYLKCDLYDAYVHGSLGTYEEISYSDFDALVVLRKEVFETPCRLTEVAKRLYQARSIMFDFDPLQHHGWFVMTETDFEVYPESYFPNTLFKYAKSMMLDTQSELTISPLTDEREMKKDFENMAKNLITQLQNASYPKNIYQLKSLLSGFMLLPTLYIQAKNLRGIFKKQSFDLAKKDFASTDWEIMEKVSEIRRNWDYRMNPIKRYILSRPEAYFRYFTKKFAPKIAATTHCKLTPEFYGEMINLVKQMETKVDS